MTNYYEALGLNPDVETEVIQTAIDSRYNEWRQLATHPDPTIVEEANRNLRLLEQARMTLTDPSRRAAYDAGIGLGGGGLADPSAILQKVVPPPPKPRKGAATQGGEAGPGSGLWACPKCGTDNPSQTKHCFKCGTQLVRECPACGQMASLVATGFCGNCGARYEVAVRLAELSNQQTAANQLLNQAQTALTQTSIQLSGLQEPKAPVGIIIGLLLIGVILMFAVRWLLGLIGTNSVFCVGSGFLFVGVVTGYSIIRRLFDYEKVKRAHGEYFSSLTAQKSELQQQIVNATEQLAVCETELAALKPKLKAM